MSRRVRARIRSRVFRRRAKWAGAGVAFAAATAAAVVALMVLPGPPPPAGGGLVREETKRDPEKPASDAAGPADSLDAVSTGVSEARDVFPPAEEVAGYDELVRRIEEKRRRIEESRRPRARRPDDGVHLVGRTTEPRRRRPPPAPRVTVAPGPPLLGVIPGQRGDPGKTPVVVVDGVVAGSPADRAGLKPGDVILAIDAQSVRGRSLEAVAGLIRRAGRGARITITYARDGKPRKADATLAGGR
jgi:membrane-associated protease RseP (regulator of RpoE activity)